MSPALPRPRGRFRCHPADVTSSWSLLCCTMGCMWVAPEEERSRSHHRHFKAPANGFYLKLWKKYLEIQGAAGFPASRGRCWRQRKEPTQHLIKATRWQESDSAPTLPGGESPGSVQGQRPSPLSHRKLLPGGHWAVSAPPKVKLEGNGPGKVPCPVLGPAAKQGSCLQLGVSTRST